jgi:hypothetical protein
LLYGAGVAASIACAAQPGDSAGWGIERLMRDLAQVKSARATFIERKHLGILNTPLELSGTLNYIAPDRLEKHTLAPRAESLVLEREVLTLENRERKQRRTLALRDHPVIQAYVESIRATLAGDLPTLTRFYEVGLEGGERGWRLTLKPSEPGMQEVVREIRISGERSSIRAIEVFETNGDRSVMTITRDGP